MHVLQPRLPEKTCIGAYTEEMLAGYIIAENSNRKIHQIAVKKSHRRKGIATALISALNWQSGEDVTVLNVPEEAAPLHPFLNTIGMQQFITQYEMHRTI